MTRMWRSLALVAIAIGSMAHVGSPDTFFTGQAGPYSVRVSVRLPGVIPGLAPVTVRVSGSSPDAIKGVTVQAIQWNVGPEGAPPPDPALPVAGDPELYAADLWFMAPTSYRVQVAVNGTKGEGSAVVPVMALATAQKEMSQSLGLILSGLALFLVAGLLTIVNTAVRESGVPPGELPTPSRRRRAWIATALTGVILALGFVGGRAWWNAEASAYGEFVLYRPFKSEASINATSGRRVLTLKINDRRWPPAPSNTVSRYNALMPDHGKLMHMFLIREDALDVFAHVHPVPRTPRAEAFDVELPPLPVGRYRVYGDIVHESGYAQTLVDTIDIGDPAASTPPADADLSAVALARGDLSAEALAKADDSWFAGNPVPESASPIYLAADGTRIEWIRTAEPFVAGAERLLTFVAHQPSGARAALEPYMGMIGHVAVARVDGDVFAHLHPSGSISMAALQKFSQSTLPPDPHAAHTATAASGLTTPYAFPKSGDYRIWVQVKRNGQVITAPFAVTVH